LVGSKGRELAAPIREEIVEMLKRAYADEMLVFHFYWYTSIYRWDRIRNAHNPV